MGQPQWEHPLLCGPPPFPQLLGVLDPLQPLPRGGGGSHQGWNKGRCILGRGPEGWATHLLAKTWPPLPQTTHSSALGSSCVSTTAWLRVGPWGARSVGLKDGQFCPPRSVAGGRSLSQQGH